MGEVVKYYSFVEPTDNEMHPSVVVMSEKEILEEYFDFWATQMRRVGKEAEISEEKCIDDWCVVHWAIPEVIYKDGNNYYIVNEWMDNDETGDYATLICINNPDLSTNVFMKLSDMEEVDEVKTD